MGNVPAITDAEFQEKVLASDKPCFVDYWADWCSPCKQLSPIVEELAAEYGDRMNFFTMDADANPITPTTYGVRGLPTIHILVAGTVETSLTGGKTKNALVKAIEEHL